MDKLRALSTYARSLRRHLQGSGELLNTDHIFYEADREIRKNGWEEEAYKLFEEELETTEKNLEPVINEYIDYVKSKVYNEDKEKYFNLQLNKLGVDGVKSEAIKYLAHNGINPSKEELDKIIEKRNKESEENIRIFLKNQAKIANGEDFNKEELLKASRKLRELGLYEFAVRALPVSNCCIIAEETIKGYDSGFKYKLY